MSTNTADPDDRLPTEGPGEEPAETYRYVTTTEGRGLIYHPDEPDCWIESGDVVSLAERR